MGLGTQRGIYRYRRNGELIGVTDTYAVEGTAVHSVREQPGGARFAVDALTDERGLVGSFDLTWAHGGTGHIARRVVRYEIEATQLAVTVDGERSVRSVAPETVLFPLLRVFQGAVILAVAEAGPHGRSVVIPDLHDLTNPDRLLHPTVETRTAHRESEGTNGVDTYVYEGSVYDANARFFIDRNLRQLTGYRFPQGNGTVFDIGLET